MKIEELKERLQSLDDPRRTNRGNYRHKLEDIIIIGLCSIICEGEDFVDMEDFGKEREEFLCKFLELPNGIPDSDTFKRVFEKLNPESLSEYLVNWLEVSTFFAYPAEIRKIIYPTKYYRRVEPTIPQDHKKQAVIYER